MSSTYLSNQPQRSPEQGSPPAPENICAVVVTYYPDQGFPDRLSRIRPQVGSTVVIDNGSDADTFSQVQSAQANAGVAVIRNSSNLGVAAALNQGVQWAQAKGYAWVLLFDQDTISWPTTVEKLIKAYQEFPDKQRLAILGCNRFLKSPAPGASWWAAGKTVITSGTLLSLDAARTIGPFRNEFFIDCVDFEFCLRARSKGFEILEILEPIMTHSIGNPKPVPLPWLRGRTANHQPWRWYYMIRNNVVLIREYFWREPLWAVQAAFSQFYALTLALLFDNARRLRLKYAILGLCDGLSRRFDRVII